MTCVRSPVSACVCKFFYCKPPPLPPPKIWVSGKQRDKTTRLNSIIHEFYTVLAPILTTTKVFSFFFFHVARDVRPPLPLDISPCTPTLNPLNIRMKSWMASIHNHGNAIFQYGTSVSYDSLAYHWSSDANCVILSSLRHFHIWKRCKLVSKLLSNWLLRYYCYKRSAGARYKYTQSKEFVWTLRPADYNEIV